MRDERNMDGRSRDGNNRSGVIAWFVKNPVAANLLMVFLLVIGAQALLTDKLTYEIFPEFESTSVTITTSYTGATPLQVEQGITLAIEQAVSDVEGVDEITSVSSEGRSRVVATALEGYDLHLLQRELEDAVARITTFPQEAESPAFTQSSRRRQVIDILIAGEVDRASLVQVAERVRDDLLELGISTVEIDNKPQREIEIAIDPHRLEEYRLDLASVAARIRAADKDGAAGSLESRQGNLLLRTSSSLTRIIDYGRIPIKSNPDGSNLLLGDIADIAAKSIDGKIIERFNNQRAVNLEVFRSGGENALEISRITRDYVEENLGRLPAGVSMQTWRDFSEILRDRLNLMLNNGLQGFVLVLLVLSLFLRPKVAFWVSVGIPISFCGTLALMPLLGASINMITLFGFILVLGIVVDDAIVTGESIFSKVQRGEASGANAAIVGTHEIATPVTFGVLTTVAAFVPLATISGHIGNVFAQIPVVVIPVLLLSLIESKFVLPSHLSAIEQRHAPNLAQRLQQGLANGLERFIVRVYQPFILYSLRHRYITFSLFIAASIVILGVVTSGWIRQGFLPRIPSDTLRAYMSFYQDTPFSLVETDLQRLNQAALELREEYGDQAIGNIQMVTRETWGFVAIQLASADKRPKTLANEQLLRRWRKLAGDFVVARSITFRGEIGRFADPIAIELRSSDTAALLRVAELLKDKLAAFPNLFDIGDDNSGGKQEISLKLKPDAPNIGLTLESLSQQVRNGYYGYEVDKLLDGRDEIQVMLRYPEHYRNDPALLGGIKIRTDKGQYIPLGELADIVQSEGTAEINRINRQRTIKVTADADKQRADIPAIQREVDAWLRELLASRYPQVNYVSSGENKNMQEALKELGQAFVILLVVMYALLAVPLRSYYKPLLVMMVIPFAASYSVLGHLILGMDLSLPSYMGMVALAGVAVNDSLVLVVYINRKIAEGEPVLSAAGNAGVRRFRPVILTSLTTFLGLMPLMFEKSVQARFILPSGVSLGWGILFTTFATLVLVPALYLVLDDIKQLIARLFATSHQRGART